MCIVYLQKQFYIKCRLCNFCKYLYLCRSITFNAMDFALIKNKNKTLFNTVTVSIQVQKLKCIRLFFNNYHYTTVTLECLNMVHKHPNGDGCVENMFIQFPLMLVCINYMILCNTIINMLPVHKSHGHNIITRINYSQSMRPDRSKCRRTSTASSSVTSTDVICTSFPVYLLL